MSTRQAYDPEGHTSVEINGKDVAETVFERPLASEHEDSRARLQTILVALALKLSRSAHDSIGPQAGVAYERDGNKHTYTLHWSAASKSIELQFVQRPSGISVRLTGRSEPHSEQLLAYWELLVTYTADMDPFESGILEAHRGSYLLSHPHEVIDLTIDVPALIPLSYAAHHPHDQPPLPSHRDFGEDIIIVTREHLLKAGIS